MDSRFADPDYELLWPRTLFKKVAADLLNRRSLPDWDERCALLLEHAFVGGPKGALQGQFSDVREGNLSGLSFARPRLPDLDVLGTILTSEQRFLRELLVTADRLGEANSHRRPYYSERRPDRSAADSTSRNAAIRSFVSLISEFDHFGYFDRAFGTDCEDEPRGDSVERLIEQELSADDLWPLTKNRLLAADEGLFFDIIEMLHDNVARPDSRTFHSWNGCGWHYGAFDIESGRVAYRWRTNQILNRSNIGLRLADEGEDIGRLVAVTDDARMDLVQTITARENGEPSEQVQHALALFRQRGADRHQKRSAVATLYMVLEELRHGVLTDALAKSDRDALFHIANSFHIRHQKADQKRDYDDFYLDWVFWVYLSSIELTNRIIEQQNTLQVDES